jgi:hypothetical protein
MRRSILTAVALGMFLPISGRAQEMPTASKWTDVEWYQVVHIDFKYGKRSDALRIIREHLAPAGEEAGTPPPVMSLHHETGQWDLTTIWHMSGPSELEWGLTPNGPGHDCAADLLHRPATQGQHVAAPFVASRTQRPAPRRALRFGF